MRKILIGSTGFVGRTLAQSTTFDASVHRPDVDSIRGDRADVVVCAGLPAAKWQANQEPTADLANVDRLAQVVATLKAGLFVLISTVDAYQPPVNVDESDDTNADGPQAYGRNRSRFERFVAETFPNSLIIRLPALYGRYLRKNLVFDLLERRPEQYLGVNPDSTFQFFDVAQTWDLVLRAHTAGLQMLNVASEPVRAQSIADLFGARLRGDNDPVHYSMKTQFAEQLGFPAGPYLYTSGQTLDGIRELRNTWTGANES